MFRYIKPRLKGIVFATILYGVALLASMKGQLLKGRFLDGAMGRIDVNFTQIILWMVLCLLLNALFHYGYYAMMYRQTANIYCSLRFDYWEKLFQKSMKTYYGLSKGQITAEYTQQLNTIYMSYIMMVTNVFEKVLLILVGAITLWSINWKLTLVSIAVLTLPIFLPRIYAKKMKEAQKLRMEANVDHMKRVSTWLRGMEVIKNFQLEQKILDRFSVYNNVYREKDFRSSKIGAFNGLILYVSSSIGRWLLIGLSAYFVYTKELTPGEFFSVISIQSLLMAPLFWFSQMISQVISARPVVQNILTFIDGEIEDETKGDIPKTSDIVFDQVTFGYDPNKPVVHDISMTWKEKGTYLLVGESGSGKSTLIRLLLGIYSPQKGQVTMGGLPMTEIRNIAEEITVSHQDAFIFQGTLEENLTMGRSVERQALLDVLTNLGLERLANEEGLAMAVGGADGNLSGGEKKRVGIARALLKDTPILVLDEPLANIDPENVERMEDYLLGIKDRTLLIITHQWSEDKMSQFTETYELKGGRVHAIETQKI